MSTKPGQTGVDATWIGDGPSPIDPEDPSVIYAELKPDTMYGVTSAEKQIANWGLEGEVAVFFYNANGIMDTFIIPSF